MTHETMPWHDYARCYDLMAANNPAYQALLDRMRQVLTHSSLRPGAVVVEFGAGTGNFSTLVAGLRPEVRVVHIEPDAAMNAIAAHKSKLLGLANLEIRETTMEASGFAPESVDVVLLVHSLYTIADPQRVIQQLVNLLRPGGRVVCIDLGRPLDIGDWFQYLAMSLWRTQGAVGAARTLLAGRPVARHNRTIARLQRDGTYYVHSTEAFAESWRAAGLRIDEVDVVYRGYSDLVVGTKILAGDLTHG
jgi:ubiquinone/menaquinone biosynthesis C-methylase UbiE